MPYSQQQPFREHTILVAEDDLENLRMIAKILEPLGIIHKANDGQEALEILESGVMPDVIVTDVMMPRLDGFELAAKLKSEPHWARIPIVFLTARTSARDMVEGIKAGARHYITKPFKADELLLKVQKAIGPR